LGTICLRAHAKVNLFLRIVGSRQDGYHDIESVVVPLELHDRVQITTGGDSLTVEADWPGVPDGPENLCHRAALVYQRATGRIPAAAIRVLKNIPPAAGIGGGSADAAATLVGLNEIHGRPLPLDELTALAADIGADVPLFLADGPALIEGVGERVTVLQQGCPLDLVLAKPSFGMDTAEAYRLADEYWQRCPFPVSDIISALQDGDVQRVAFALYNEFWEPVSARHPELRTIRSALVASGALGASLTGSGTCVFGVFPDSDTAAHAAASLKNSYPWVVATRTVPRAVELSTQEMLDGK